MPSARPELILFVSRRGWKCADPLFHAGWKPKVIICQGRLPQRLVSIFALWVALLRHPRTNLLTDTAEWIGLVTWLSALLMRRRYVLRLRGDAVREFEQQNKRWHLKFFLRHLAPDAAGIIPVSHFVARELQKQAPQLPEERIRVIPTPQSLCEDSPSFGLRKKVLLVVTSFRLAYKVRALTALLPAIDRLLDHDPEAKIVVAGNGPLLKHFKKAVARLEHKRRISVPGFVRDVRKWYLNGMVLLHISDLDAYPSVVNEARACGMPVIVSDTVGLTEQVEHGMDGIILDGRPETLIRAWDMLSDERRWMELSVAGRERVGRINGFSEVGRQFTEAISEMLGKDNLCKRSKVQPSSRRSGASVCAARDALRRRKVQGSWLQMNENRVNLPHICHIATTCNLHSGSAKRTLTILKACVAQGYQTTCICGRSHDITSSDLPGGRIIVLPDLVKYIHIPSDLKALASLVQTLKAIRPDLVHTHLAKAGILGRLAAKLARVPVIVHTVHGPTFARGVRPVNRVLYWVLEKMAARCTDFFVFVGRELRRSYIRARICSNNNSTVIYTGRPLEDFHLPLLASDEKERLRRDLCDHNDPRLLLLSVGRIVPSKRQEHAVDVLSSIWRKGVDVRLAIVGQAFLPEEQRYRHFIEQRAQHKGVSDRVHFPGFREDILRVIQAADAVVLTSQYEGLPNIAVEAIIGGTPLISYALPGVAEVIEDGRTGVLVPESDLEGIENAVLEISSGKSCVSGTTEAGLRRLETEFSVNRMVDKTITLYQWLIATSAGRSCHQS